MQLTLKATFSNHAFIVPFYALVNSPIASASSDPQWSVDLKSAEIHVRDLVSVTRDVTIFRGTWKCPADAAEPDVLLKFAPHEQLAVEADVYDDALFDMQGVQIPHFHGLFSASRGDHRDITFIVTEYCGNPLSSFDVLSSPQRLELMNTLVEIHRAGVIHDFTPQSISRNKEGDLRVINFSRVRLDHECRWTYDFNVEDQSTKCPNSRACSTIWRAALHLGFFRSFVVIIGGEFFRKNGSYPNQDIIDTVSPPFAETKIPKWYQWNPMTAMDKTFLFKEFYRLVHNDMTKKGQTLQDILKVRENILDQAWRAYEDAVRSPKYPRRCGYLARLGART